MRKRIPPKQKLSLKVWAIWISMVILGLLIIGIVFRGIFTERFGIFENKNSSIEFDVTRAFSDVEYQVSLGPRTPGSEGHRRIRQWIAGELVKSGWETEEQNSTIEGHPVSNIIGKLGEGRPWIVVGAHYDTRFHANLDPDLSKLLEPVPGANDGASGVAVLLELARQLPGYLNESDYSGWTRANTIWLVFFDAEDNGKIEGWNWILGSRAFVAHLQKEPDAAVIIDMIGDRTLNIYKEENSDPRLNGEIWDVAEKLGYRDYFQPYVKYSVLDDHISFLEAGIPAIDIIDFEYAFWHTTSDTPDKISPDSLGIVGRTLLTWLLSD